MIGLVAAMAVACSSQSAHEFPKSALFAGLSKTKTYDAGQRLLEKRISERYVVGKPEGDLESYLRSQGMEPKRVSAGDGGGSVHGLAQVFQGPGVCDKTVVVNWYTNPAGILTELKVIYSDTGCL